MIEAVAITPDPFVQDIQKQIAEEVGDSTLTKEQNTALQMKFGLIAPQLTASENYLIQKEERKRAGNNNRA